MLIPYDLGRSPAVAALLRCEAIRPFGPLIGDAVGELLLGREFGPM